jgi:uncharacterized protein (TIGR03435 family)
MTEMSWSLAMVIKATATLLVALAVSRLCRRSRASVRHLLFATTFGSLLVLPLADAVLPAITVDVLPATSIVSSSIGSPATEPGAVQSSSSIASTSPDLDWGRLSLRRALVGVWFLGVVVFAVPVVVGLFQVRRLCRQGVPWQEGLSAVDRVTLQARVRRPVTLLRHESVPGPLTCGVFRPTIVVPLDAVNWSAGAQRRALLHEITHIHRRDWMTHCVARIVCAVYWFHPLIWIAWRRLILEAERACDDAVIGRDDGREYASLLISIAQRQEGEGALPILAMAGRGDLSVRVAALLDQGQRRGDVAKGWIAAALIVALFSASTVGAVTIAQSTAAPAGSASEPSFDVVSIKRNLSGTEDIGVNVPTASAFQTVNVAMLGTIMRAYQVKNVVGAPDWVENERYDIEAKAATKPAPEEVNAMLRTMFKQRMNLKAHIEVREIPVYALVVARPNHPGLRPFTGDCEAAPTTPPGSGGAPPCGYTWSDAIRSGGITIPRLAGLFDWVAGRVVVDRTGLSGRYEFTLRFTPPSIAVGARSEERPDLFTALQEQLGLRLEPTRAPVDTLVIDSIQRPSEN